MMKSSFSTYLVYATMLLLAAFLSFWVYGEYQREKEALKKESYLDIAEKLIDFKGGDLYGILAELENATLDTTIVLGWSVTDSFHVGDTIDLNNRRITHVGDNFSHQGTGISDTTIGLTKLKKAVKTDGGKAAISIVVSSDPINQGSDQKDPMITSEVSMEFVEGLQGNLMQNQAVIRKEALKNILPETLFALFLFGLLTLGIYLLRKSYINQQELLESKNNLISNLTHELQTPITTIGVALEAIQDFNIRSDEAKTAQYIRTSRNELNRLSSAIDQVMLLSKLDNHSERYNFQEQHISSLCREVLDNLHLQVQEKNASTHLVVSDEAITARVDETHFKHMLYNLIDNSLKYGNEGVNIEVMVKQQAGQLLVAIKDDGPGIDPKYHQRIFDRFYRVADGDRHDVKGYGLGLSYVKEIVEAHNGSIRIESQPGKGTTFTIEI